MGVRILDQVSLQYAASTDAGLRRSDNEDCYVAAPDIGLWLVADGVGGHSCGEVASDIVHRTMQEQIAAGATLEEAVRLSHQAILARIREDVATKGMGSTLVALLLRGREYEVAWVGDSRAYIFKSGLTQITNDHSRINELIARDLISKQGAHAHPQRHVLTQSLGTSDEMELNPGSVAGHLQPGEQILLCSDGLSDELSDGEIASCMASGESPGSQVDALMLAALKNGGADNITVVAVGDYPSKPSGESLTGGNTPRELEITLNRFQTGHHKSSHRAGFLFKVLIALIAAAVLLLP